MLAAQAIATIDPDQLQYRGATEFSLERPLYSAARKRRAGMTTHGASFVFESALLW